MTRQKTTCAWTDRKGQITSYQYDALDRQTFAGFGTTGTPPTYASTITTTYDGGDRATAIDDSAAGMIERTYDLLDRLTDEATTEGTITYTYDDTDRRATILRRSAGCPSPTTATEISRAMGSAATRGTRGTSWHR